MPELEEELKVGYETLHNDLVVDGKLPPTENVTVPAHYKKFDQSNPTDVYDNIFNSSLSYSGPASLGKPGEYSENRFQFITTEEGYNGRVHMVEGIKHVGYGTNLEANPKIVQDVLGFSPEKYKKLLAGEINLDEAQSRRLFDYKVQESEKIVQDRLEGVPLNASQRIALVSMAYNSPALIGPNLVDHLKKGDAASVSYEILNLSNGNKLSALDARRKREHDQFFGNNEEVANIVKGQDYRKSDSFNFASLLGISSAQAGDLKPFAKVKMSVTPPIGVTDTIIDKLSLLAEKFSFEIEETPLEEIEPASEFPVPPTMPEEVKEKRETNASIEKMFGRPGIDVPLSKVDKFLWGISPDHYIPAPVRAVMIWGTEGLIKKASSLILDPFLGEGSTKNWSPAGKQTYGASFFSPEAQDVLTQMAEFCESKGKKSCQYEDWDELFGEMDVNGMYASEMVNFKRGLYKLPALLRKKGMTVERPNASKLHDAAYGGMFGFVSALAGMASDFRDPRLEALMTIGQFTFTRDEYGSLIVGNDNKEMDDYNFKKNLTRDLPDGEQDEKYYYRWFRSLFGDEGETAKFGFRVNLGSK